MGKQYYLNRILILFMFISIPVVSAYAQTNNISGIVSSSETGEAIPGVTVLVKGGDVGTVTTIDGKYSIQAKSNDILIFSYIGFNTKEVNIEGKTVININMNISEENLEEVVVVGYGTVRKSHFTGSTSKVMNDGLDEIPVSRADEALVGKLAGVTILNTDASAGGAMSIRVRGVGSITQSSDPLIVIDGIPMMNDSETGDNALSMIDMNIVESIEVLKDAASCAIYGSRGANGVIMVTTKQGKTGKPTFTFNSYYGTKFTPEFNRMPSVSEWNDYITENNGGDLIADRLNYINQLGTETDWEDVMFDGGNIESYSLSASGGTENTSYIFSGSYLNDGGVLLTDNFKKYNLNVNVKTKINKFVELGIKINPSYSNKRDFPIGIHDALRQSPWLPEYHDENTIQYVNDGYPDVQIGDYTRERHFDNFDLYDDGSDVDISTTSNVNPLAKVLEREENVYKFDLKTSAYLKVKLFKGFNFRSNIAVRYYNRQDEEWLGSEGHRNGVSAIESAYDVDRLVKLLNENYFTYNTSFSGHNLSAVAGISFETWDWYRSDMSGTGYEFNYIRTLNAATTYDTFESHKEEESLNSIFSRISYDYHGKYLMSLSLRYDGSSKFGPDNQYGFFPAVSVGWRVTEEDFMKNIPVISNLKPRFSYGETGSNDIDNYAFMSTLDPTVAVLNGISVTGLNPANIANPSLRWEHSVELNPGIDLGLFNNRLNVTFDYYNRTSKNLLLEVPVHSVTGFTDAWVNRGIVENKGVELEVMGTVIANKNFNWNTTVILAKNKNTLLDFAGASGLISYVDAKRPAEYIAEEGYPISSFYGYVSTDDIPLVNLNNAFYPIGGTAQDVYVQDLNGDGIIDTDDRAILGSPYPELVWSFNNSFSYKGVDFSFMFQGSHGAEVQIMDPQYMQNQFSSRQDYITDADDPNFFEDGDKVVIKYLTDRFVQNASYVALRSLNLGYTFSKTALNKIGVDKLRVYFSGANLLFFMADDYTGFNPEGLLDSDDVSPLQGGYQRGSAPIYKSMTVGINLQF